MTETDGLTATEMPVAGPRPRREVTNDEFNLTYFGDPNDEDSLRRASDNRNIIKAVAQKYNAKLTAEELQACALKAMWKCLQYHRDEFGQKFTTSLHRFAKWECLREVKQQSGGRRKHRLKQVPLHNAAHVADGSHARDRVAESEDLRFVRTCLDNLEYEWQREVLRQYYFENLTLVEIGDRNGYSKQTASDRVEEAIEALSDVYLTSLDGRPGVSTR